ncbi:LamG-like jellyroll fold domain-containing protein [Planctomycetota bacterium]
MKKTILIVLVLVLCASTEVAKADFVFGTPTIVPNINTSSEDFNASISADGLSLYFISSRAGGVGGRDIWVTTRETTDEDWGEPVNLGPTINTSAGEWGVSISHDGLSLYFDTSQNGSVAINDLWVATRATTDDDWGNPVSLGPTVNSSGDDYTPSISADGLSLYFNSDRSGGVGAYDLWVTTRETIHDPWGTPVNLGPTVNSSAFDVFPGISADGLALFFAYFASDGSGGYSPTDIWMTRRATTNDDWGEPVNLGPIINSSAFEDYPSVSADGSTLFFRYSQSALRSGGDIWQAPIIPIVDFNGDGIVDAADMSIIVDYWGKDEPLCDIGPMPWGDGIVDVQDLIVLSEHLFENVSDPTLIAHWAFDETEGMFAAGSVGNGINDAFVVGGAAWQPGSGQVDGALQLNGVDGCAIAGAVLNPADGPFSIFAWINGGAPGQVIVSQQGFADWLTVDAEGNLMTELKCTGRSAGHLFSETVITDGQWHRIGLVWDGSNRTLYIDGVKVAEDTQPGLESSQMGLYIGTGKAMEPGTYFSGLIDDVRVYNRVVSP